MGRGEAVLGLVHVTVDWDKDAPPGAMIIGGRWDGHSVMYMGPLVEYKGERYVALLDIHGKVYYLLERLTDEWFSVGR